MIYQQMTNSFEEDVVDLIPALNSFARTFHRSQTDVDDLVQETLTRALGNIDKFRPGSNLKSWLFTIMRNLFCSRFRIGKREMVGLEECVSDAGSVAADQEWRIRGHELERACGGLKEPFKSAFEFVFIDGRTYEEAAEHFHGATGTVKSRVNRARQRIAAECGEAVA
ncbi:sigma-70 family RNA polymerase sigma factor [Rhizobium metallidurans]|uniref:RNA polymerase sigma-70 factor (ECF subfamily) n=1 Tax=Rhizobium metallidurans TaxID=1265931 RepID=A0A7W6GB84_9HYPH|nr:sigma-70 family RNA polymerase sigma factor [Rhizobium metallidurans]MBB3965393.1 RNA polymerase sigma-70 factor (ECF subfamily) [Rhizobium metallidurans]